MEQTAGEYAKAVSLDQNFTEGSYANWLNATGGKALLKGGPAAALPFFQQAIELRPHFAEAHIGLGTTWKAMGKTNEARREFRAAINDPPTTPLGLVSLGNVCCEEGWTNEAIQNLEAALNLDPTDSSAHFNLGVVLFGKQEIAAARRKFKEALRCDPGNTAAQSYLDRIQTNHLDRAAP